MTNKLIIAFGQGTNNIVEAAKTNIKSVYFPIENYNFFRNNSDLEGCIDIWAGMSIFKKEQAYMTGLVKDYDTIIIVAANFSSIGQGFIYCFSKYLKRKNKKLEFIINGNFLSPFYLAELKRCGNITDVYQDKEYKRHYNKRFPKSSILEMNGYINTIYLKELKKHTNLKAEKG